MKKSDIFWQTYLNLEKELIEVSKYIFVTDVKKVNKDGIEIDENCTTQLGTFSPHIADLLVRCCVQIEAISKELYHENGGTKPRGDNSIFFDEDCLKLIDIKWETHKKQVLVVAPFFNLTKDENLVLRPLKEAHKRQGTYWGKAYQAVKHDRYASLCAGNVKALIHAMAALYLLNLYLRKDSRVVNYQDLSKQEYSMGSALFAVKPPITSLLWYGNQPLVSESPFVVTYQNDVYKHIEGAQKAERDAQMDYWVKQPELKEPEFIALIDAELEKMKQDPSYRVLLFWELAKYRLMKMIPKEMPFEERKHRLITSEAWKGSINQHNKHLAPDEITEENIDSEIESVAIRWGIQIERGFKKEEWESFATTSAACKVFIPD